MRRQQLFSGSWLSHRDVLLRSAIEEVERLDSKTVLDPGLAGRLQKIAEKHCLRVASLKEPTGGKRRTVERNVVDHGRHITIKQSMIDVTIPYTGDGRSFDLAPSHCTMLYGVEFDVLGGAITLTVPDDENVQNAVGEFTKVVSGNLDTLRREVDEWKPHLTRALEEVAERRRQQFTAEKERDTKVKFPIR